LSLLDKLHVTRFDLRQPYLLLIVLLVKLVTGGLQRSKLDVLLKLVFFEGTSVQMLDFSPQLRNHRLLFF
jgi:hypothetical protein